MAQVHTFSSLWYRYIPLLAPSASRTVSTRISISTSACRRRRHCAIVTTRRKMPVASLMTSTIFCQWWPAWQALLSHPCFTIECFHTVTHNVSVHVSRPFLEVFCSHGNCTTRNVWQSGPKSWNISLLFYVLSCFMTRKSLHGSIWQWTATLVRFLCLISVTYIQGDSEKNPTWKPQYVGNARQFLHQNFAHKLRLSVLLCVIFTSLSPKWRKYKPQERILQLNKKLVSWN